MASITDELREWASVEMPYKYGHQLTAIADRIDAEHERLMQEQPFTIDMVPMTDESMAEHGWVKLPVDGEAPSKQLADWIERRGLVIGPLDANGELWHSGDMSDSNWGVIESIAFEDGRWLISGHDTSAPWIPADSISHYHAPTVEDLLMDLLSEADHFHSLEEERDAIAEYAARLRLAGDGE